MTLTIQEPGSSLETSYGSCCCLLRAFEQGSNAKGGGTHAIQINITGVNSANISGGDVIDGDSGEVLQD